jgi:hypothetical protein
MPVATQNKITQSGALSFVVGFSMIYSHRQFWAKARDHCGFLSGMSSASLWATHGRVVVIAAAALRGLGKQSQAMIVGGVSLEAAQSSQARRQPFFPVLHGQ